MPDQLQQLADQLRLARPRTLRDGHWTDATQAIHQQLADAIVADGHPERLAQYAVTGWIICGGDIRQRIQECVDEGTWRQPAPARGRVGFTPDQARPQLP